MRKFLCVAIAAMLYLFTYHSLQAQSLRYNISMPYTSMGAYSSMQTDPFGFTGNQAALAKLESAGVGVWGERRFMLSETSVYGLAAAVPTKMGNFGLQLNYSGFANFNDNKIGLAYARSLGKLVDLGVQFNYYGYRIPQYGNASAINFEIGAIMHFSEKFHGGIHVYNPVGGKLGKVEDEKLASAYKLGLGYDASDNFLHQHRDHKRRGQSSECDRRCAIPVHEEIFCKGGLHQRNRKRIWRSRCWLEKFPLGCCGQLSPAVRIFTGYITDRKL